MLPSTGLKEKTKQSQLVVKYLQEMGEILTGIKVEQCEDNLQYSQSTIRRSQACDV